MAKSPAVPSLPPDSQCSHFRVLLREQGLGLVDITKSFAASVLLGVSDVFSIDSVGDFRSHLPMCPWTRSTDNYQHWGILLFADRQR